ncbi:hypothetical protein H0H87_008777, partial [Tephrocybe sp. NHM501043]
MTCPPFPRALPWTASDPPSDTFAEAIKALDTYKQRDPFKGTARRLSRSPLTSPQLSVGNAPIMKQNFYKITSSNRFQAVIQFLRKELGWQAGDPPRAFLNPCFTYVYLVFSPAPDDTVSNLFK